MKQISTVILILTAVICAAADTVQMFITPRNPVTGEPAEVVLSSQSATPPAFVKQPAVKGIAWLGSGTSMRQQIINGRRSVSAERRYSFVVEKEGTYTIPETAVQSNGKEIKIKPLTFTVKKASLQTGNHEELDIDKAVFTEISLDGKNRTYFVGEYIPVEIKVYCLSGTKINLDYPGISSDKDDVLYRNYQAVNPENPRFDRPRRGIRQIDGKEYICYLFRTELKMIAPGKQQLNVQVPTQISVPSQRSSRMSRDPFFDDFFNMGFSSYRTVRHTARAVSPVLEIKPLPPLPTDVNWLGLVGNWTVTPEISAKTSKVGNAITLTLKISGTGGLENLKTPDLKIPDFRMYAPEAVKNQNNQSAEIRYTMIPTKTGTLPISLKFCTLNSKTGTYTITPFSQTVTVEAAAGIIPVSGRNNVVDSAIPERIPEEKQEHSLAGIMYLKKLSSGDSVQNNYFLAWLIGIPAAGVLAVIICEILAFLLRGTSTAVRRKNLAKKQKKSLLKKMNEAQSEQIYNLAPEISEYINNALDLSPGTSLDESAEWIGQKNPELADELKNISAGAWAPGAAYYSEERKQNLMKMLAKLLCLLLCFSGAALSAAEFSEQETAIKAYDSGNFRTAREWYTAILQKQGATPALLYNIGNCCYQEKEYAKALFCYERAHLLAPRDMEILRNLELTRRELGLPPAGDLQKPSDIPAYLRNQMTPGEWMILAVSGIAILLLSFGLRRFFNLRVTLPIAAIGAVLFILGTAMTVSQYHTTYAADRAMVLVNKVRLRTLPSDSSAYLNDDELKAAETVEIRERRDKWVRIKAGNAVGWVPAETIGQLNGIKFSVF